MTTKEKRDFNARNKLVNLLQLFPGTLAKNIPMSQRRLLRNLELEGVIKCVDYKWYLAEQKEVPSVV